MNGDPWQTLRRFTDARIALGRTGHALPAAEVLRFQLAHAQARDAVGQPVDFAPLEAGLRGLGYAVTTLHSQAGDRATYLKRPDWGRLLDPSSQRQLVESGAGSNRPEVVWVIGDGLSAFAVERHAVPVMEQAAPRLAAAGIAVHPTVFLARQARVALGDEIGAALNARLVIMLIGERPGLSSPDSLGIYLTFEPRHGRQNAERNCISNVRPAGLSYQQAAVKVTWLAREALRLGLTGVGLKDGSDDLALESQPTPSPALDHQG